MVAKGRFFRCSFVCLLVWLALFSCAARAEEETAFTVPTVLWTAETEVGALHVRSVALQGEAWLFLPSSADLSALPLTVDTQAQALCWRAADGGLIPFENGSPVNWSALAEQPILDVYSAALVSENGALPVLRLHIMVSANLRSMHILSADPENEGRQWLEDCLFHERFTSGTLVMLRPNGSVSCFEGIEKLRGRGNSTWEKSEHKKPYQLKLQNKRDLLESGDPYEANKKWVLLSNEAILTTDADLSMLRNQIALDLGREFGLANTSRCEQVDLYYDHDYRGAYLLCEKVEVKKGRLDITDYDELLKDVASMTGVNLDALPFGTAVNRYGQTLHFTQGVPEPSDIQSAGFLIELERGTYEDGTVSDPAWFTLSNGQNFALKNPSKGGIRAVTFASELMEEVYAGFSHYGFDPATGAPVSDVMDVDSFTRSFLLQEALQNKDAYASTSTNFVVYPYERKLYAGPIWDFDLSTEKVMALRDNSDWVRFFYRTTVFQKAAKRIYPNELYPLIRDILLGEQSGAYLQTLTQYEARLTASWNMNYRRFFAQGLGSGVKDVTLSSYVNRLRAFYDQQSAWLLDEIASWSEDEPSREVEVCLRSPMGDIAQFMTASVEDEQRSSLHVTDMTLACLREATQEANGIWRATITLASKPNCALSSLLTVLVNGEEVAYTRLSDTAVQAEFVFENPLYRPAVLDGVDYGLVFHFAYFAENYPDLLAECGGTMEGALRYYLATGMDEGLICSDYFDPTAVPLNDWNLEAKYQDDWRAYIELFLGWQSIDALDPFVPESIAAF